MKLLSDGTNAIATPRHMMNWTLRRLLCSVVWLFLLAAPPLVACQSSRPMGAQRVAGVPTLVPTARAMTETPPPSPPFTMTPTPPLTVTPGPSGTPTRTAAPTRTPVPSPTPTETPTPVPPWLSTIAVDTPRPNATDSRELPIPTAVPTYELPDGAINILLLGNDTPLSSGASNTDTILIVSVNVRNKTAAMLSLPRDLYVYVPGWRMANINQALSHGDAVGYPTGAIGQVKDTILYNFGVPIHYYAQIDFAGFRQVVDALGGVDIAVGCSLTDWRLKSPDLNVNVEENWEMFTLEQGVYHMDGDLALWYARSRKTTSDFDRNRRQQQILHALLNKGVDLNLLEDIPALWETYRDSVRTDLDIGRILQFATIASSIRENGIEHLHLLPEDMIIWRPPTYQQDVFLVNWDTTQTVVQRLFTLSSLNRSNRVPVYVELLNHTGNPDMALLAADNLAWQGFIPIINPEEGSVDDYTEVTYYASSFKGSYDWLLSWVLDQESSTFLLNQDDDAYPYNYRVVLGADFNPCRRQQYAPRENLP